MIKLNLGSGNDNRGDYINIDITSHLNPDIIMDLSTSPLPFNDNVVSAIDAIDFFEHILNPIFIFNECWRVMKPGGILYIETPIAGSDDYYADITHVRPFVKRTFEHMTNKEVCEHYGLRQWGLRSLEEKGQRLYVNLIK